MNALELANDILNEMNVIVPVELVNAAGFTNLKEMVMHNATTRRLFVGMFVARCGSEDVAIELLQSWGA